MYVFPVVRAGSPLAYLAILLVFWVAAYFFNKWLKHSLRNGPKYGKRSLRRGVILPSGRRTPPAMRTLMTICFGDKQKAERLIAYELQRNPRLTREQAIKAAVDRVAHDNRSWR